MSDVGGFDYFFTATCNDARTFGVRRVRAAILTSYGHEGPEMQRALQAYCAIMCRCWERTIRYFMHWLQHSPEQPCGQVMSTWFRYEFQTHGAPGNKPHVHGFVKVADEEDSVKLARIKCRLSTMFSHDLGTDRLSLRARGLIEDERDLGELHQLCNMLCFHQCEQANSRCQKVQKDGSTSCRVQQHPPSLEYSFKGNPHMYNPELLDTLQQLGLTELTHAGRHQAARHLIGGRWQYPADRGETFIPTIPILFAVLQSCTNVQYIDQRFQVSYVCKYAAGVQEHPAVRLTRPAAGDTVTVQHQHEQNVNRRGQGTTPPSKPGTSLAREIGQAEMTWYALGLPFVITDTVYTHISTLTPEYRSTVVQRTQPVLTLDGGEDGPIPVQRRRDLPPWRQFTPKQVVVLQQYIDNIYHLDSTWRFSLRPPELMLFDTLQMYCKWFIRGQRCRQYEAVPALGECVWIDGAGYRVYLRQRYVAEASEHIYNMSFVDDDDDVSEPAMELYCHVFGRLQRVLQGEPVTPLYLRFVDTTATQRNVVVFSAVTPFQFPSFLVHLLPSKGHFKTELDLYSCGDLREAFVLSGLLPSVQPLEAELAALIRAYVTEQLQWLPMGNRKFQAILHILLPAFQAFLFEDGYLFDTMPLATDMAISAAASDALQRMEMDWRHSTVAALLQYNFPDFPDVDDLRNGVPTVYNVALDRAPAQSDASFVEQTAALHALRTALDTLHQPGQTFLRFPLLVGPPGCGKTHLLMLAQAYAMSKGMRTMVLTFTAERAQMLGGQHIHLLFGIPVVAKGVYTVNNIAEMTLGTLAKNPLKMEALCRIQVFILEEIGLVSAEMFAIMDLVLRRLRASPVPFGGIFVLASGDPLQLPPVEGMPIWCSRHLFTTFRVFVLHQYVRCALDRDLRRLITILRQMVVTDQECTEFSDIITRRCFPRHFVPDWEDVPPAVLRVLSTRKAVATAVADYLRRKRADPALVSETFASVDEVETSAGTWVAANEQCVRHLNHVCAEEQELFVCVGAVMRLTFNNTTPGLGPRFSQGQLCVVNAVPQGPDAPTTAYQHHCHTCWGACC